MQNTWQGLTNFHWYKFVNHPCSSPLKLLGGKVAPMCIIPCRSNQNSLSLSSVIIYLKALWKLTYHQALFDSLERHTRKPFKSQLSDLLCLEKCWLPIAFRILNSQAVPRTGCCSCGITTGTGLRLTAQSKQQDSCGRAALRASLLPRQLPGEPSCAGAPLLLPDAHPSASCSQAFRSLHVLGTWGLLKVKRSNDRCGQSQSQAGTVS